MIGVVVLAVVLVMGVINAVNMANARRNAAITANIAKDAQGTYALLLDCLDSQSGACGKRNAVKQKAILDEIKKYELTVIYCARTNPVTEDRSGDKFIACVDRLYPTGPELNGR